MRPRDPKLRMIRKAMTEAALSKQFKPKPITLPCHPQAVLGMKGGRPGRKRPISLAGPKVLDE